MHPYLIGLISFLMLASCSHADTGSPIQDPAESVPVAEPGTNSRHHQIAQLDTLVPEAEPAAETPADARTLRTKEIEGCEGHMRYADRSVTIITYIPQKQFPKRAEEIREMLPDAFVMAEQTAPRSISCDLENGTSTEHIDMPDTLPVVIRIHDRCSTKEPYHIGQYLVWKDGQGGWGITEK